MTHCKWGEFDVRLKVSRVYKIRTCKWGEFDGDSPTYSVDYILWRTIDNLYAEQ